MHLFFSIITFLLRSVNTEFFIISYYSLLVYNVLTMKKIFLILTAVLCSETAFANNPMFAKDTQNSITLYAGQGTGSGSLFKLVDPFMWDFEPMTMLMLQYSQPSELFRLPSRINLSFVQNFGYHHDHGLSFMAVGISWDVAVINWNGFYLGVGIGPYMRDSRDRYVESRLVFGEKFFIGKNITDHWRAEFFTLHFSNGDFTEINRGFNYTGLAINYSF